MPDIEIKRGYEILPDNNVRFGIRITNNTDYSISDVEIILDHTESLFYLEEYKVQKLGNIPPTIPRTAKYTLKPLGCVHKENIEATILYRDHKWEKHVVIMHPKEVHCVYPFLKEKTITQNEFFDLSKAGQSVEVGLNFQGVNLEQITSFLLQICRNRLYKVDEYSIEGGYILFLASDSIGEEAYYLLTAIIKENEGLTQVMLRAVSDKSHGINGFLNEIVETIQHMVSMVQSAKEIGIIKKEQVINIIDSVVQRTTFTNEDTGLINNKGSVIQHIEFKENKVIHKEKRETERKIEEKRSLRRQNYLMIGLIAIVILMGLWLITPNIIESFESNIEQTVTPTPISTSGPTTFTQSPSANELTVTPTQVSTEGIEADTRSTDTAQVNPIITLPEGIRCYPDLPEPELIVTGTEEYEDNIKELTIYWLKIVNWANFPDELFGTAPELPPCGLNKNASRTWLNIYSKDGSRIYGYCALDTSKSLQDIGFSVKRGEAPPEFVYITLTDRWCNTKYNSNLASTEI